MIRIKARKALRDFTLDVDIGAKDGETIVLMGNNGSGKTTVLNLAAGLATPDEGIIAISGRTLYDSAGGIDVPPEKRNVGYAFQHYALFPHMTVFDNVAFGLRTRKVSRDAIGAAVREELERMGLWELRDARAAKLSGGQKQKVALARSLVIRPSLLLLDEPMSSLDAETCISVRDNLSARIRRDRITTLLVTHSWLDAMELGDRAFIIDRGRVKLTGDPSRIRENTSLFKTSAAMFPW